MKNTTQLFHFALIIIFWVTATTLTAQQRPRMDEERERIEAMKIAFLTRKMQLNPDEAREFWPVYNAYQEKMKPLLRNREKALDSKEQWANMTDEEINEIINMRLNYNEQTLELRKQLIEDLLKILPPAKVLSFMEAEQQFNRELQKRINQRQGERPNKRK